MAKLVLLSPGHTGRSHELTVDRTTVGRVEDNTLQIAEPSVSSHHCEILLQGSEVRVKDLNSTNGTFINNEKVTEAPLKLGQILRLGQIEMKLEGEGGPAPTGSSPSAAPAPAPTPAPAPSKKPVDQTVVMQRGVKLDDFGQGAPRTGFDSSGAFSKKKDKASKLIWIIAGSLGLLIILLLLYALTKVG